MLHAKYYILNAFELVVHEKKIFDDLSKFTYFAPLTGPAPLFEQV